MQNTPGTIPKIAMQSIAGGLLLMGFFTVMWSGIAAGSLSGFGRIADILLFWGTSVVFMIYAFYFFNKAKHFDVIKTDADRAEGKKMGIAFGIIFALEGICIPIAAFSCLHFNHPDLILPAIALIVGLHFFPMAKIFQRTIDYYLATWATLVALAAIILTLKHTVLPVPIIACLGIGVALTTVTYGLYVINIGKRYLKV